MKTFCPVHCFNYTGSVCPFCEKDRFASLAKRHVKNPVSFNVKKEEPKQNCEKEVEKSMDEMLQALASKFNKR